MSLGPTQDVRTLAELASQAEQIIRQVHQTGRPITVTTEGQGDVVIVDAEMFDRCVRTANLTELLRAGEADVQAGRVRPIEAFLSELERDEEIPG